MKKDRLASYCMLPVEEVVVESRPNRIFWKWCDVEGKIQEGVAQNKRGVWKLYVEVKHGQGPTNTFNSEPTDQAWENLYETASKNGYSETGELYADKVKINLPGDTKLEVACKQLIEGDKFRPELVFDFEGDDTSVKITVDLDPADLEKLGEMLSESAARILSANK